MRLYVRIIGTEQAACFAGGSVFYGVHIVAAAVIAVLGVSFGIFIGQQIAHRRLSI